MASVGTVGSNSGIAKKKTTIEMKSIAAPSYKRSHTAVARYLQAAFQNQKDAAKGKKECES